MVGIAVVFSHDCASYDWMPDRRAVGLTTTHRLAPRRTELSSNRGLDVTVQRFLPTNLVQVPPWRSCRTTSVASTGARWRCRRRILRLVRLMDEPRRWVIRPGLHWRTTTSDEHAMLARVNPAAYLRRWERRGAATSSPRRNECVTRPTGTLVDSEPTSLLRNVTRIAVSRVSMAPC